MKTSAGAESSAARLGQTVRPRLRGWLHAGAAPVVLAAGIVLVTLADPGTPRLASVLYAVTALMLFATSARVRTDGLARSAGLVLDLSGCGVAFH